MITLLKMIVGTSDGYDTDGQRIPATARRRKQTYDTRRKSLYSRRQPALAKNLLDFSLFTPKTLNIRFHIIHVMLMWLCH